MLHLNLRTMQALHQEHLVSLALLEKLEDLLNRYKPGQLPPVDDAKVSSVLTSLQVELEHEVNQHFTFEEEHLFPRFSELADPGIPMMLKGEHDAMRPLAGRICELVRESRHDGFSNDAWDAFHRLGRELGERMLFHIQKEEMGFLPALDQMLDESEDASLGMTYAESKG